MTQKFSYFTSEPKAEGTNEKKKLFPVTVLFPPIRGASSHCFTSRNLD